MSVVLNWASAHADATDLASMHMRRGGRKAWSSNDAKVYVARLEHLAQVFYRHCYDEHEYGPIDLREAWVLLAETKPSGFVVHHGAWRRSAK